MAISSPSTASSRTSSLPFTDPFATLRHFVECRRESTPLRSHSALPDYSPPLAQITSDHSMPHNVYAIEKSDTSLNLLNQAPPSSSVPSTSENGSADDNDTKTPQHSRKDTFDPLDQSCNRKQSSQVEHGQVYTTPPLNPIDEKDIGVKSTVILSSHALSSGSLSSAEIKPRHRVRNFLLHWATAYRILIGLTFIVNIAVLAIVIRKDRFVVANPLISTAANIFVAVLVRQEDLINVSFSFVAKTPASLPLWLRKTIADFHHYGGLHIGCSMSALLWYCYFVFLNTNVFLDNAKHGLATGWMWADIITCYAFLLSILVVCILAHPRLRVKFHDAFEHTHRFGGWTALLVLWINAGVASRNPGSVPLHANAALWLLACITFLIILPWTRIRRVPVTAEAISSREVRLTFPYKAMPYTSTTRFSISPLLEWHAFATIPSPPSPITNSSAYIVISQAGDWTKSVINSPPTHIWLRKPAAKNFLAFAPLFNSLLLVATGAGIGPLLSLLSSPAIAQMRQQGRQVRVMWCVYDPNAAHWQFVQDIIRAVDPEPKIFDSRDGRPELEFETASMKEEYGLEAVMVVSNAMVTREILEGIKGKGGAAYGAVFDS